MIRVAIAEDHKIVRDGLRQVLLMHDDIEVVHEAGTGTETVGCFSQCSPDLVLMDMSMPDGGAALIEAIRRIKPTIPILVLSMHCEPEVVRSALDAGADGYLTKTCDAETLIFAIRRVGRGERFLDPSLTKAFLLDSRTPTLAERLSARELEIFTLLVRGQPLTQIALSLGISVKTVSTHKANLMEKLAIHNNAELTRFGIQSGIS
ncbi:MAG: DNA-binding response regulator [Rhodocyclaceae bacterium]|nr:MAG: DNA-binding response regulator [Rhodocyclaceae bacterium]